MHLGSRVYLHDTAQRRGFHCPGGSESGGRYRLLGAVEMEAAVLVNLFLKEKKKKKDLALKIALKCTE